MGLEPSTMFVPDHFLNAQMFDGETGVAKGKNKSIPSGRTWRNAIGNQEPISEWSGVAVGQIAGAIDTIKPAQEIVHDIMGELSDTLRIMSGYRPRSRM